MFLSSLWLNFTFLFDQIELHDGLLRTRHAFKVMSIESDQITSITKQKGLGVVFKLKDGRVHYGPDLGNATSTCNVLKAWLKKQTRVAEGSDN